jgi:hypothetical protein
MPKRTLQKGAARRIVSPRTPGLAIPDAPFWRGETAEAIVDARRVAYAEEKAAKASARRRKGGVAARSPRHTGDKPSRELSRLIRALKRRKTLAARQRVQARIDELQRQLGGAR